MLGVVAASSTLTKEAFEGMGRRFAPMIVVDGARALRTADRRLRADAARPRRRSLAELASDTSGGALMEYAFVGPMFIALLLACLYTALVFLAQQGLETAAEGAARLIMTGQAQTANMTAAQFKTAACAQLPAFLACDRLYVDVQTINQFSTTTTPPTFTYSNGVWSANTSYSPGQSNQSAASTQIEVLRLMYIWPVPVTPLGFNGHVMKTGQSDNQILTAASVMQTENF